MKNNFPARLRDEIKHSIQRRHEFSMRKLSFCAALLGFGALEITNSVSKQLNLTFLLYLVPVVAIAFDLYIVSEDFRVKRVGEFLGKLDSTSCSAERAWERFVKDNDNPFAPWAFFIVSIILLIGATILLLIASKKDYYIYILIWFVVLAVAEVFLFRYSRHIRFKLGDDKVKK